VRSTHAHARLRKVDCADASACPDVVATLTSADLQPGHDAIAFGSWLMPNARVRAAADPVVRSHAVPLFARDRAYYVGQPIAVVLTDSHWTAEDVRSLVEIDYEPLSPIVNPEEALARDAPKLHDDWPDNLAASLRLTVGDPDRVLGEAPVTIRERFRVQRC